uniref:Cytochrome c oxidase subunit 4 n=1 Tax=Urocitellus parryii TaxID=9999 RepID=A0A8D2H7R8_UROPR
LGSNGLWALAGSWYQRGTAGRLGRGDIEAGQRGSRRGVPQAAASGRPRSPGLGRIRPSTDTRHAGLSQKALKEKENASWSNLTRDEKVELYPIQFNESFDEMNRVTNEWKTGVGAALFFIGFTALVLIWEKHYMFGPIPHIFDEEWVAMQTKRILDMKVSPIQGSSDMWDYDKNERSEWKKNVIHIHNGLLHIYKDG